MSSSQILFEGSCIISLSFSKDWKKALGLSTTHIKRIKVGILHSLAFKKNTLMHWSQPRDCDSPGLRWVLASVYFLFFFWIFEFYFIFLYSRFLLVIHFIHISVYLSIPISQYIFKAAWGWVPQMAKISWLHFSCCHQKMSACTLSYHVLPLWRKGGPLPGLQARRRGAAVGGSREDGGGAFHSPGPLTVCLCITPCCSFGKTQGFSTCPSSSELPHPKLSYLILAVRMLSRYHWNDSPLYCCPKK